MRGGIVARTGGRLDESEGGGKGRVRGECVVLRCVWKMLLGSRCGLIALCSQRLWEELGIGGVQLLVGCLECLDESLWVSYISNAMRSGSVSAVYSAGGASAAARLR